MNKHHEMTGFLPKTMEINGQSYGYVVYVPDDYTPEKNWPLVVFLHGAGERGNDNVKQAEVGIGKAIRTNPERFPCIVVMPQCPTDIWWHERFELVDTVIADTLAAYKIDHARICLTGLSMGGFGTWLYGAKHPDMFAALMPICGGGNPLDAKALAHVPIWAFHGADDTVVPPKKSTDMVAAIKKAGGTITYTEYKKVGHQSWTRAYGNAKAIRWLLSQKKKS